MPSPSGSPTILRLRNWAVDVIYDDWQKVIEHIAWFLEG